MTASRVITAYALAFGSLLLLGGRLCDWFGRKWTLIAGLTGFALASAAGGAAQSFGMLAAARTLQGAFGALLAPVSALSLLTTTFTDPAERARAFGIFAAIAGSGASIGLLLGGALTQSLGWRYCMYVDRCRNRGRPRCAGARAQLAAGGSAAPRSPGNTRGVAGAVRARLGCAHAQTTSWANGLTVTMIAAGVVLLAAFVVWERRAASPLLPLRVVADRNRGAAFLSIGISGAAIFAVILFLTYYLQQTRGYSPIGTGLAFLPDDRDDHGLSGDRPDQASGTRWPKAACGHGDASSAVSGCCT